MKKYEMIKEGELFRIVALRDFGNVSQGDKGGLIAKENNLSHDGDCWVYGDAMVYGDALVYGNARVYGNAKVSGDAMVSGNARVSGDALVSGNARVYGDAMVYGDALVYGNARVYGDAMVYGDALVYGNARVYGNAKVSGNARVSGDARVFESHRIQFGTLDNTSIKSLIASSLNVYPVNGTYYLYKRVNKIGNGEYASCYNESFIYRDGETAEVETINSDTSISCGDGLHVSTPFYWNKGDTLIAVEVHESDVICCQEGKLRVKKLNVVGEVC